MASMDKAKYRVVLQDLHSELADVDIKYLKFLVQPLIKKRQYEDIKDGLGLFEALEKCAMLSASKMMFLCQLLETIRRKSLISKITGEEVSWDAVGGDLELVCPFRKMLFDLSLEIPDENLFQMRYLCNVPQRLSIKDALDLFMFMIRERCLAPDNLGFLKKVFIDVSRKDLCEKVEAFEGDVKPNECNYRNALTQKKRLSDYWTCTESQETPYFGKVMPFWECNLINRMLHLTNNADDVAPGQPGYDLWFKVLTILDHLNTVSR
ncbi:caspase-8 [Plakobranchus ocellatus]|uniref:Caspase-8 n=1 Tax=Plakobranchus ocellatus TaxID=259542 RepID=A0AAV4C5M1_9GAST|nr:caspase-8 [Plakobranchus ocellatus]